MTDDNKANVPGNNQDDADDTVKKEIVLKLNVYDASEVAAAIYMSMGIMQAELHAEGTPPPEIEAMVSETMQNLHGILSALANRENYESSEFLTEKEARQKALAHMSPLHAELRASLPDELKAAIDEFNVGSKNLH